MSDYDQRNRDFCRGMTEAQFAYIEAERRVEGLKAENAKLAEKVRRMDEAVSRWEYMRRDLERMTAERDHLKAENAELVRVLHEVEREAVHAYRSLREAMTDDGAYYFDEWLRSEDECDHLKFVNDGLRELARTAWRCAHTGPSCSDCRLTAGGCTLQSAMRELGIEVPK